MFHWLLLLWAPLAHATTPLFPVVQNFKDVAEFAITETNKSDATAPWLTALNQELNRIGLQILDQYQKRHAVCGNQLSLYLSELPNLDQKPISEILSRFHDGVGLPEAPKHCIYGRVYSVHPLINLLKLKTELTTELRKQMIEDLSELVQYIPNLQKNLEPQTPKETQP